MSGSVARVVALTGLFAALLVPVSPVAQTPQGARQLSADFPWRNIGPANMSGRITDIDAVESDFSTVLVGAASGGVWKSTTAGTTWEPIFDQYGTSAIGDVQFFQPNPDIIWVGTGETCVRNSVSWGDGVYKSTDGGRTFTNMGLRDSHHIADVVTHPTDPNVVYVASQGHLWGHTGERGVFKTTDGGTTWQRLTSGLPDDGRTGATELKMDPRNPNVLYAAFWERVRLPYRFESGGPNGGIYKTTDAGRTWQKLTNGLPEGPTGKIGLAIHRANPQIVVPGMMPIVSPISNSRSRSLRRPRPALIRSSIDSDQAVPSRQGVHCPQLSWAKNRQLLCRKSTMDTVSSSTTTAAAKPWTCWPSPTGCNGCGRTTRCGWAAFRSGATLRCWRRATCRSSR